ncbi:MAG: class II glutamine amidotransferase [Gemmatimonadetes bacterium]|nr:class II glutamine amidotransferase [Gemmatimonadota bacterium]
MCRWLAYGGNPVPLEDLVFLPEHSLIHQSLEAHASPTITNGDGFGVGWYDERGHAALYRSVQPAWNDVNLREVASHVRSRMFLAHVRATTGTAVQQTNCHPFRYGRWLFCHNGEIQALERVKRELMLAVDPGLFPRIEGTTDSEIMFYLALSFGLERDPLGAIRRMAGLVEEVGGAHGLSCPLQMTLGIADGERMHAVRYSSVHATRTLFVSRPAEQLRVLYPRLTSVFSSEARVVVSEPLANLPEAWEEVPESTFLTIENGAITSQHFEPEYSGQGARL